MIKLKRLLREMSEEDVERLLDKINNKEFSFFDKGANGRIYKIDNEDFLFKITTEQEEYRVAATIVGRHSEFTSFIPVHYVNNKNMYIMSVASALPRSYQTVIDSFIKKFHEFSRTTNGEVSVFDYAFNNDGARDVDVRLVNFLQSLQRDIAKIGITDLELDLDFRTDNIMLWNGNLVMIDW